MKKLWEQVDNLKKIHPKKGVHLSLGLWFYTSGEKEAEWSIWDGKKSFSFPTFKALIAYIEGLAKDDDTVIDTEEA